MSGSNPFDDLAGGTEENEDADESSSDANNENELRSDVTNESSSHQETESAIEVDRKPEKDFESTRTSRSTHTDQTSGSSTVVSSDTFQRGSIEGPSLSNSSPPFPYSEAEQKQMYVQDGLWDEFEDLGFDAELELRRTFDVRNVEQRELDTAVIRLVLDQFSPREIAEMVIQMRGFDPSSLE